MIAIEVLGEPAPKGSMRAMLVRGRPMMIPGGSAANQRALNAWTKAIRDRVGEALGATSTPAFVEQPLEVHLLFRLERPTTHHGARGLKPSAPLHPIAQRDDIDKLARSTLDALTGLLFDDDGRIVTLLVSKQYATSSAPQGVVITIDALHTGREQSLPGIEASQG